MVHAQSFSREDLPAEDGFKETAIAYQGKISRVKNKFDIPKLYVWRCLIVEHRDNEVMRP